MVVTFYAPTNLEKLSDLFLQRHLYEHAFLRKDLWTRKAPHSPIACDKNCNFM